MTTVVPSVETIKFKSGVCICNNKNCDTIRQEMISLLGYLRKRGEHAWSQGHNNEGVTSIECKKTAPEVQRLLTEARRRCAQKHLSIAADKINRKKYIVALHHYPRWLLEEMKANKDCKSGIFRSAEQARKADVEASYGNKRFSDPANAVNKYLKMKVPPGYESIIDVEPSDLPAKWDKYFVPAPCFPMKDVETELKELRKEVSGQHRMSLLSSPVARKKSIPLFQSPVNVSPVNVGSMTPLSTHSSPPNPGIRPVELYYTADGISHFIRKKFIELNYDEDELRRCHNFTSAVCMLYSIHKLSVVPIDNDRILRICSECLSESTKCLKFTTRLIRKAVANVYCDACLSGGKLKARREKRKRESGDSRTSHNSCTRFAYLNEKERLERLRNIASDRKKLLNRCYRMKITEADETMEVSSSDTGLLTVLKHAFDECKAKKKSLKTTIVQLLITEATDCDENEKKAIDAYATSVVETIDNYRRRFEKKEKTCRYSPHVIRTAMAFWLLSPGGYQILRENNIEMYPSEKTLYRVQKSLKPNEGFCAKLYGWVRDEWKLTGETEYPPWDGVLMFDEMTFTSGLYTNAKNNTTSGFAASDCEIKDTLDLKTELYEMFQYFVVSIV